MVQVFPHFPKSNFAEFLEVFCSEIYHLRHIFIRLSLFLEPLKLFFLYVHAMCKVFFWKRNVSCELNAGGYSVWLRVDERNSDSYIARDDLVLFYYPIGTAYNNQLWHRCVCYSEEKDELRNENIQCYPAIVAHVSSALASVLTA